jgi:hypothetical protein
MASDDRRILATRKPARAAIFRFLSGFQAGGLGARKHN